MKTRQSTRLGLLRLVLFGSFAVPALAASAGSTSLFGAARGTEGNLMSAPPPIVFVVVGVAMVAWAVGRRHIKGLADVRQAESQG
ncbi:MAG: hypothetical protein DRQ55_06020 [Planctomycetota bacterium]|nr:MAG: hypothetical protein DRQ55_06020 [Planctomycetota bacterium]